MNSQSPAEALRQQLVIMLTAAQAVDITMGEVVDAIMKQLAAYAATVEREAELKGRIDEAEYWWSDVIPATNNAVIKRAEDRRRELYDRLAALQGPPDDNEGAPDDKG